ncbi:cytochrome C oxidase subunit IV family protein [Halopseudomonas nanhaiensis]|uniref:cytochrome C oxidase subunit IV family protein n=1 Tax=Halopseudomonas nanhaiensis TaxID=2830842 RepID=UPI001CBC7A32|nr:cytochrome C oxidase subunit IV family protein [Halopseudomonas nanhaiensis]UAW99351.1 cytochrome C oxidase subunit IV family protein [Halopseudomonas nanhaiensis]
MKRRLRIVWLALLILTLVGWWLGHSATGAGLELAILALTVLKGQWLIDRFMDLRHAPSLFRLLVSGWLIAVISAVGLLSL